MNSATPLDRMGHHWTGWGTTVTGIGQDITGQDCMVTGKDYVKVSMKVSIGLDRTLSQTIMSSIASTR